MKRSFTIAAVLIVALAAVPTLMLAQSSTAEQEVLALQNKNIEALVKADVATLDKSYGDELIIIGSNGLAATKADTLDGIRSGKIKFISEDIVDSKVRVDKNLAVMNTTEKVVGSFLGNDISGQYRATYVYVKRGGKWLLVQRQATKVMPPKAELTANAPPSYVADPSVYKLVGENDQFKVIKATWAVGQRDAWHSHMPLAAYPLTDCHSRLYTPDGKSMEVTQKVGDVKFLPVVASHSSENIGTTECEILIVERK